MAFGLIELMIALALSGLLVAGLVQVAASAGSASRLQDNQAMLQDRTRMAVSRLSGAIRQAGYSSKPWDETTLLEPLANATEDGVSPRGDRLAVQEWSDRNCFDQRNPELDASGRPRFYLRVTTFDLNDSYHLTHRCEYGPDTSSLTAQIRRQGLIPGVEAFQLQFAHDADGDNLMDSWVRAGEWSSPNRVLGMRLGLLLRGDEVVAPRQTSRHQVLDFTLRRAADGRLRRQIEFSVSFRGRST